MNIRDIAYSMYDNRYNGNLFFNKIQNGDPMNSPLYTMTREEFADQMVEANRKRWESGEMQAEFLYNGSGTRAQLSKTEIIALANKYDVRNMDDDSYDALLDDLESMGAISSVEKIMLGYGNWIFLGYPDENGEMPDMVLGILASPTDKELLLNRQDAEGDVFRWINDRIQWEAGGTDKMLTIRRERAHKALADIINRMQAERSRIPSETATAQEKQRTSDGEREEILEQLRSGEFFTEATARILEMARKLEEEKKKQATIDALSEMLDSISGRDDEARDKDGETANGLKLGLSADQKNTFQKGFMPLELQVYLRNLGVSGAFEAVEPDEDEEVQETEDAERAGEKRTPEETAAEPAESYDPRHMSVEEFRSFMDGLAESGAMSAAAAERIKNAGQWTVTVWDQYGNAVEPLAWRDGGGGLADSRIMPFLFGEHSMDGDVLAWAQLGSADSGFRDLADILSRMEEQRKTQISEII